jgi:hypothetical protein
LGRGKGKEGCEDEEKRDGGTGIWRRPHGGKRCIFWVIGNNNDEELRMLNKTVVKGKVMEKRNKEDTVIRNPIDDNKWV